MTDRMANLLAAAGLPTTSFAARLAGLPAPARRLHQGLLTGFAQTGAAPDLGSVAADAGVPHADLGGLVAQLAAAELLSLDAAGHIGGVFPFSATTTRHRVAIDGGATVSAMCAVDALGIPAMLARAATITSSDPLTAETVTVRVCGAELSWEPSGAVVVLGRSGNGPIATSCCAHIDFYADHGSARRALASLQGTLLSLGEAHELGVSVFADLLAPGSAPHVVGPSPQPEGNIK